MMFLRDCFAFSFSDLRNRKGRTMMNMVAIAIGVALVVTLLSLAAGTQRYALQQLEEISSVRHIAIASMAYQDPETEDIAAMEGVNGLAESIVNPYIRKPIPTTMIESLVADERVAEILVKYETYATEVKLDGLKMPLLEMPVRYYAGDHYLQSEADGLALESGEIPNYIKDGADFELDSKMQVLIPENIAMYNFGAENPSELVGKTIQIIVKKGFEAGNPTLTLPVQVAGIIHSAYYQPSLVVTKDVIEKMKSFQAGSPIILDADGADEIELTVKQIADVPTMTQLVQEEYGFQTTSVTNVAQLIGHLSEGVELAILILGVIIIFIASTNIINAMIMAVHEQTRKIGLMRATGVSRWQIQSIFLVESAMIGFLGALVGVAIGWIGIVSIQQLFLQLVEQYPIFNAQAVQACIQLDVQMASTTVALAVILAVMAGFYPSLQAARLSPIDAIRRN